MVKFYSIMEISQICNISQKTVRRQIASGKLKAYRIGNQWRIEERDFDNWVNTRGDHSNTKEQDEALQYSLFGEPTMVRLGRETGRYPTNSDTKVDAVNWIDIADVWNKKFSEKYTYIDLFSGAGGLSLGLEMAGFRGLVAVEFERTAVETYRNNFDHPVIDKDIRESETKQEVYRRVKASIGDGSVDLICGGFPCQGFSMSGYRVVEDKRNSLYSEMVEIIRHLRPKFLLMENVVGLRSMLHGKVEEKIMNDLQELGYSVNVTILNSTDYYVPQLRKRVIFIGNNIGKKNYHPSPLRTAEEYLTTREAIEDLISHPDDKAFNHEVTRHSPKMQERLMRVPEGKSLYDNYSDAWKKCPWDKPSCTIKENHGGVNIHPKLPRVLTVREMARLQSFPDRFIFRGAKKWQQVQVGNAVPPLLGKAIGLAIRKSLEEDGL
jgi:DNA (cytosine-5)-methyltransferase 1